MVDVKYCNPMVQTICSDAVRSYRWEDNLIVGVKENKTGTWLGFTRLASPVMRIKPRTYIVFTEKVFQRTKVN
jgi:hypothetical protein